MSNKIEKIYEMIVVSNKRKSNYVLNVKNVKKIYYMGELVFNKDNGGVKG